MKTILLVVISAFALAAALGVGIIIGHFGISEPVDEQAVYYRSLIQEPSSTGLDEIVKLVNKEEIKKNLEQMTSNPHQAGTAYDFESAEFVRKKFVEYGLDGAQLFDYDVLLDYPNDEKYNNVEIRTSGNVVEKTYEIKEDDLGFDNLKRIVKPFLAYTAKGSVTSDELYFANYCLEDDFEELIKRGYTLRDKIVLCKYGKVFRGNKILMAQNYGAKAVIVYDDPINSVPNNQEGYIYPHGEFLPDHGTQRGSTILAMVGDPLTPYYPSTDTAYRLKPSEVSTDILTSMPAQVVGYQVAYDLFTLIEHNNNQVQGGDWKGSFNLTYVYGGKLRDQKSLTLNVFNERQVKKTYNVMGFIKGSVEEDQYVMVGNHRDAWNMGALDPTSGTATVLELARVLMAMKRSGAWKPRRSVMFMSWGAEEYGLIGSIEWVEEYQKKLDNAVVYINVDTAVKGNHSFQSTASPLLKDFIFEVTQSVKHPDGESVYERWRKNDPGTGNLPSVSPFMGAGSDFMPFAQRVGLPCSDHSFVRDRNHPNFNGVGLNSYPAYHTAYETFDLMVKYVDPTFEGFRMLSIVMSEMLRQFTERLVLPFNCLTYARDLEIELGKFEQTYAAELTSYGINMQLLRWSVLNFTQAAEGFNSRLEKVDKTRYDQVRKFNEQMRRLEKAFLDFYNPDRKGFNHLVFAPSLSNSYGSNAFPGMTDAIYAYKKAPSSTVLLENVKKQYSSLINSIQSASFVLREPSDFTRYSK